MEKAVEKKESPKKTGEQVNTEYVKLSEMEAKDIIALPKFNANLVKQKSRRGQVLYKISIEIDPLLVIDRTLRPTEYNCIIFERKLNPNLPIQHLAVPGRLLTGKSATGRDWFRYELFVSKTMRVKDFFKDFEVGLINAANLKLNFIHSPESFNDDEISSVSEEDFL